MVKRVELPLSPGLVIIITVVVVEIDPW